MKSTTTKKRLKAAPKKAKQPAKKKFGRIQLVLFASIGTLVIVLGTMLFNQFRHSDAFAQSPLPIQTFQTTYKGYTNGNSWMSWLTNAQRCTSKQTIYGAKPTVAGKYPTLIYLHGTTADSTSNKEGQRFVEKAAQQGFHALAVTYRSSGSLNEKGLSRHAYCMFDQSHSDDAMTAICATVGANCEGGVLMSGFSQGAAIAAIAKNYNNQVKAVWAIGLSAYIYPSYKVPNDVLPAPLGNRVLPSDKLVINMGEASNLFTKKLVAKDLPSLKQLTGSDCGNNYKCLNANGSGYYIVANSEVKDKIADHCYWQKVNSNSLPVLSCTGSPKEFEPGFQSPATTDWSMTRNLNWLKNQL